MIVSCFVIFGPVLSRLESFYGLSFPFPIAIFVILAGLAAFYDLSTVRRIHLATVLAFGGVVFVGAVGAGLIATGAADALIDALR